MTLVARVVKHLRSERSQSMTEFAIIAPVLMLVLFGIVDFGRGIYYYVTLQQAVNEGARISVRAPAPPADIAQTTNNDILNAMQPIVPSITFVWPTCPNGPIDTSTPPAGKAYVYITQPNGTATPPAANAPGGQTTAPAGCNAIQRAGYNGQNNVPLQVEARFNFVPITPLIAQVVGNKIVITAYAAYRTEY
jgi:Flp pilus assembly protein TadG